jgi:hypothetical protein
MPNDAPAPVLAPLPLPAVCPVDILSRNTDALPAFYLLRNSSLTPPIRRRRLPTLRIGILAILGQHSYQTFLFIVGFFVLEADFCWILQALIFPALHCCLEELGLFVSGVLRRLLAAASTRFFCFAEGGVFVVVEMAFLGAVDWVRGGGGGGGGARVVEVGEVERPVLCIAPARAWNVPTHFVNSVVYVCYNTKGIGRD